MNNYEDYISEDEQIVDEFLNHFDDLKLIVEDLEFNVDRTITKDELKLLKSMTKMIYKLYVIHTKWWQLDDRNVIFLYTSKTFMTKRWTKDLQTFIKIHQIVLALHT